LFVTFKWPFKVTKGPLTSTYILDDGGDESSLKSIASAPSENFSSQ